MDPGDRLATIAESQIGVRSDNWESRGNMYGYLMATHASLVDFGTRKRRGPAELHWAHTGFGTSGWLEPRRRFTLLSDLSADRSPSALLRFHNWCAAFVDWCVLQLLLQYPGSANLSLGHRPRTAVAFELLRWGRRAQCTVIEAPYLVLAENVVQPQQAAFNASPRRGDIAVFKFSHVGIVSSSETKSTQFLTVEGNTTLLGRGNQGYTVAKRSRNKTLLMGLVRLPPHA